MFTQFLNHTAIFTYPAAHVTYFHEVSPRQEYLLEFTSEYSISEDLHPELPGPEERIVDFLKGKNSQFFWVDERVFPTVADWRVSAPKDEMPAEDTYSSEAVAVLNTHYTPIQKQPKSLLCLVGLSRRYFLGDDVYPTFLHDDDRDMDLFNLICAPNPTKVKIGTRPRVAHEVPLLTVTASRVIEMEDTVAATDSSRIPSTIERLPLDFANENPSQQSTRGDGTEDQDQETVAPEVPPPKNNAAKGGMMGVDANEPPKVLRKDHADSRPTLSTVGGKYLASMGLQMGSTFPVPTPYKTPADVSDPEPLSFANPQSIPKQDVVQSSKGADVAEDPESENTSFTFMVGSPESIYQPEWGKSVAQVARRDQRIQARENEIKNIEALLEAETDMKKAAEAKNAELVKELENLCAQFTDLQRCAEMDARLDVLSIDFDEELYPHMLTAIAGRRWVIGHGLRLAVMRCGESTELRQVFPDVVSAGIAKGMSEGLKYGVEHEKANLDLEVIEAYDPDADTKYVAAIHALRNLKYPVVDQLESLKDAPIDVIMASLHLESDFGEDAPQWIRELRPSSSQLKIPVYPEVRDLKDPWSDGVPVSVPTVAPQGLAILLADASKQMKTSEDGASPRLLRSKSLPAMYNLDWPYYRVWYLNNIFACNISTDVRDKQCL
nr:hypothetical protein [Tanacetum cinerariifolium]